MTEIGVTAMGFLIVEYLESVKGTKDDGKVAEAAQALSEAFGVSTGESKLLRRRKALVSRSFACLTPPRLPCAASADDVDAHSFGVSSLPSLVASGATAQGVQTAAAELASIEANPLFTKLLANVTGKGFFKGTEEGSPEYKERYKKMVQRFKAKLATQAKGGPAAGAAAGGAAGTADTPPPPPPAASGADAEAAAEELKNEGNRLLGLKDFAGAVAAYTKAIQACPNGAKSHIYFANRAAARQYLKQYEVRVEDCSLPCTLSPSRSRHAPIQPPPSNPLRAVRAGRL